MKESQTLTARNMRYKQHKKIETVFWIGVMGLLLWIAFRIFIDTKAQGQVLTGTVIGTPGSYQNKGNTIAKVFDNDLNTFFDSPNADNSWVGIQGSVYYNCKSIDYAPRQGFGYRMVKGVFQGSVKGDFSDAESLAQITAIPSAGQFAHVDVVNPHTFKALRYLSPPASFGNVAEIRFNGLQASTLSSMPNPQFVFKPLYPLDEVGYETLPNVSTRIYVDNATGLDTNVGDSGHPIKTLNRATSLLAKNPSTAILVKRGGQYPVTGTISLNGDGDQVSSYGDITQPQPVLQLTGTNNVGIAVWAPNCVINGLSFICTDKIPANGGSPNIQGFAYAISAHGPAKNLLIQDCQARYFGQAFKLIGDPNNLLENTQVYRCLIRDSYVQVGHGNAVGMYTDFTRNLLIYQCMVDSNGWLEGIVEPFGLCHNLYLDNDGDTGSVQLIGNWISNGSAQGAKVMAGGLVENNVFVSNGQQGDDIFIGHNSNSSNGIIRLNVGTDAQDSRFHTRGDVFSLQTYSGKMEYNMVVHVVQRRGGFDVANPAGFAMQVAGSNSTFTGNVAYDVDGSGITIDTQRDFLTLTGNTFALCTYKGFNVRQNALHYKGSGNFFSMIPGHEGWTLVAIGNGYTPAQWKQRYGETLLTSRPAMSNPEYRLEDSIKASVGVSHYKDFVAYWVTHCDRPNWDERMLAPAAVSDFWIAYH